MVLAILFLKTVQQRRIEESKYRHRRDEKRKLKQGLGYKLDAFNATIDEPFFTENSCRIDSVNTKTFVLVLVNKNPLSFVSGEPINLEEVLRDYNRNEFHHLYPRSYLRTLEEAGNGPESDPNCLANFCFLSRADNNTLGGVAPSIYRQRMPAGRTLDTILESALCPYSLFDDTSIISCGHGPQNW